MDLNFSNFVDGDSQIVITYDELTASYNHGTVLTALTLLLGFLGNIALLWLLLTHSYKKSRLRPFLLNLAIADLMVCFFTIAMELGWRLTVTWTAGDAGCRIFSMTKTVGLYLESFVVLAMSIERCYVVLWPLRSGGQARRTRMVLAAAWTAAMLFSAPQAVFFHLEYHPEVPEFAQCVTIGSFPSLLHEQAYVLFAILAMYIIPLVVIVTVSCLLLWRVHSTSVLPKNIPGILADSFSVSDTGTESTLSPSPMRHVLRRRDPLSPPSPIPGSDTLGFKRLRVRLNTGLQLYHSDTRIRRKARSRTLRLSLLIVLAFILCYTPYAAMIISAFVNGAQDPSIESSTADDSSDNTQLTEGLLMLSLSFSTIMNPLLYGSYMLYTRKRWPFKHFTCFRRTRLV